MDKALKIAYDAFVIIGLPGVPSMAAMSPRINLEFPVGTRGIASTSTLLPTPNS
jgi:hypothetical protein